MSTVLPQQSGVIAGAAAAVDGSYTDIIIAVHGIGAQTRNSTVRSVANRLAQSQILLGDFEYEPLAPQPLGYFHTAVRDTVNVLPLDRFKDSSVCPLAGVGFTEVFWADIPQEVVKEGRTIEETKAWARTVVARAEALCTRAKASKTTIVPPDFSLASEVLSEVIDTVYVLENLAWLGERAGVMKFDLREMLDEYLGDVQIVTEFSQFRNSIIGRFESAMQEIHRKHPKARLHIVAHSEGTVVSFLGLLNAISREPAAGAAVTPVRSIEPAAPSSNWLRNVAGYMTIGSPIDKHLLLWPELFESFDLSRAGDDFGRGRIKWRNYYDYGDPVGFKLDTARRWLASKNCDVFQFEESHDYGFARYLFPGKAHNDYWADPAVFEHFVTDVIAGKPADAKPPKTRRVTAILSPLLPYVLSFVLLFGGTVLLYRAVSLFMNPALEPVQRYVRLMTVGDFPPEAVDAGKLMQHALGAAILIAGVTLFARWPRLVKGKRWWIAGAAAFAVGCFAYPALIPLESRQAIGAMFIRWPAIRFCLAIGVTAALGIVGLFLVRAKWVRALLAFLTVLAAGGLMYVQIFPGTFAEMGFGLVENIGFCAAYALLVIAVTLPWWKRDESKMTVDRGHIRYGLIFLSACVFAAGCVFFTWAPATWTEPVRAAFGQWREPATFGTLAAALLVSLIGMTALVKPLKESRRRDKKPEDRLSQLKQRAAGACNLNASRRTRWFSKRMRPLIISGTVAIITLIAFQMRHTPPAITPEQRNTVTQNFFTWKTNELARLSPNGTPIDEAAIREAATQRGRDVETLVRVNPPLWPVVLAGAGFLYLWWLAALIFDLGFVWQHYVRRSVANKHLDLWRTAAPKTDEGPVAPARS